MGKQSWKVSVRVSEAVASLRSRFKVKVSYPGEALSLMRM